MYYMFGILDSCSQKTKSEPEVKSFVFLIGRARYVFTYAVRDPSRGIICRNTVGSWNHAFQLNSLPIKTWIFQFSKILPQKSINSFAPGYTTKTFVAVNTRPKFVFKYPLTASSDTILSYIYLHSVAKLYAVLPFYDVKCLCSGGREWGREESHSHSHFNIWFLWSKGLVIWIW